MPGWGKLVFLYHRYKCPSVNILTGSLIKEWLGSESLLIPAFLLIH